MLDTTWVETEEIRHDYGCIDLTPDAMLLAENKRLIEAGDALYERASYTGRTFDGTHRLLSAAAHWLDIRGKNSGRYQAENRDLSIQIVWDTYKHALSMLEESPGSADIRQKVDDARNEYNRLIVVARGGAGWLRSDQDESGI